MKTWFVVLLAGCLAVTLVYGCAAKKEVAKDPFFEKWNVMADTSHGTSPVARDKTIDLPPELREEILAEEEKAKEAAVEPERPLPRNRVTLKMRDADIGVILRALARAADQNMVIKSAVKGNISVDFEKVRWDEAFLSLMRSNMLTYVWEGDIIRIVTVADLENELRLKEIQQKKMEQQKIQERLSPLVTMVVPIDFADTKQLAENIGGFLTKNEKGEPYGSVKVSEHTNAIILQATKDDLRKILPLIQKIDKPTPQIRIEANIVETNKDMARALGVQWGGMYGNTVSSGSKTSQYFITPGGSGGTAGVNPKTGDYTPFIPPSGISGQGYGVNFPVGTEAISNAGGAASLGLLFGTIGGSILEIQLSALEAEGKLNILSSPSITTLDNQTAFTENGERVPYVSIDEDGDREVKFEDAVLRLEITPHVIEGEQLKMKIIVKKDEVDLTRTVDGNPFIIKKQTDTTLIVKNGDTIVISGLSKQRTSDNESGVPWLKDIPFLGWAFKGQEKGRNMEEVLIFLTPRILPAHTVAAAEPVDVTVK